MSHINQIQKKTAGYMQFVKTLAKTLDPKFAQTPPQKKNPSDFLMQAQDGTKSAEDMLTAAYDRAIVRNKLYQLPNADHWEGVGKLPPVETEFGIFAGHTTHVYVDPATGEKHESSAWEYPQVSMKSIGLEKLQPGVYKNLFTPGTKENKEFADDILFSFNADKVFALNKRQSEFLPEKAVGKKTVILGAAPKTASASSKIKTAQSKQDVNAYFDSVMNPICDKMIAKYFGVAHPELTVGVLVTTEAHNGYYNYVRNVLVTLTPKDGSELAPELKAMVAAEKQSAFMTELVKETNAAIATVNKNLRSFNGLQPLVYNYSKDLVKTASRRVVAQSTTGLTSVYTEKFKEAMKPKVRSILNLVQSKMNEEEDPGNVPFTMKITIKQNVDAVTGKLMDNAVDHTVDFKYGGTKTNDAALNALGEKAVLDAVRETVASIPAADKGKTVKVFACDYSSHLP